jgi:hypothetical protein
MGRMSLMLWETTKTDVDKESKEEPPDYEDPQTETSDEEPSESGPNGLQRLGRAASHRLRRLRICKRRYCFPRRIRGTSLFLLLLPVPPASYLTNTTTGPQNPHFNPRPKLQPPNPLAQPPPHTSRLPPSQRYLIPNLHIPRCLRHIHAAPRSRLPGFRGHRPRRLGC